MQYLIGGSKMTDIVMPAKAAWRVELTQP